VLLCRETGREQREAALALARWKDLQQAQAHKAGRRERRYRRRAYERAREDALGALLVRAATSVRRPTHGPSRRPTQMRGPTRSGVLLGQYGYARRRSSAFLPSDPIATRKPGSKPDKGGQMSRSEPTIIERSVEKAHVWLNEIAEELGSEDRQYAYRALRAVLHTLRDRLTVELAAELAAQLPTLIRGIYYEEWSPARTPLAIHDVDTFLEHVASEGAMGGETEASLAVEAVARVLRRHVSEGEIEHLLTVLPNKLKTLIGT
jgi:uncharacterized protein (DUF2267 family)